MRVAQGPVRPLVADRPGCAPAAPNDPDAEKAQRVMAAMLKMGKIEIAELERAAEGAAARS